MYEVVRDVKLRQKIYCFALQAHMCKELFNMWLQPSWHVQKLGYGRWLWCMLKTVPLNVSELLTGTALDGTFVLPLVI